MYCYRFYSIPFHPQNPPHKTANVGGQTPPRPAILPLPTVARYGFAASPSPLLTLPAAPQTYLPCQRNEMKVNLLGDVTALMPEYFGYDMDFQPLVQQQTGKSMP